MMNIIFSLALVATTAVGVFLMWRLTPLRKVIPKEVVYGCIGVVAVWGSISSLNTYIPTNTLDDPTVNGYRAKSVVVQEQNDFVEFDDRRGNFDKRIENESIDD